ncbi:hypothetical protein EYZ11_008622 [Aspergillus tanneri]|uniref:LysM domain-containing protein n=1 Tax=Aspergillus tanneri TaxID=1220188 RepID=A0A4S3JAB8_9EURO|nr:hypothetical protein EYZ11_008622 [Aspergillus tanneri]
MILLQLLSPALLLGVVNAAAIEKRWTNGGSSTGTTDPNVSSSCTYWANSIITATAASTTTNNSGNTPSPTQSGLISTCNAFYKVQVNDICYDIASYYGNFTLDQFYEWNPSVKSDCSGLQAGYYVCIGVAASSTTVATADPATTTAATTTTPNIPQQSGIAKDCNKYYFVKRGDTRPEIASEYGIGLSTFYRWNPAVGPDCRTLISSYYVCVGVSGPSPTQDGITLDCVKCHKAVAGDNCWSIVHDKYTYLTSDQFYAWNPAVGKSCAHLQLGYYFCVATKTAQPMPDTIGTCKKWHKVAKGDSCWTIEQKYSITVKQF